MFDSINVRVKGTLVSTFYGGNPLTTPAFTNNFIPFTFDENATMAMLICVGGGAPGGPGFAAASLNAKGGGGGGGSGAISRLFTPLLYLPRTIFLMPGPSSPAGAAAGSRSVICDSPGNVATQNDILVSGSIGSVAGAVGTGAAGGAGGAGETVSLSTNSPYCGFGISQFITGLAGVAGGAPGVVGTGLTYGAASIFLSGGTGGGGASTGNVAFAGGAITAAGLIASLPGGVAGAPGQQGRFNPNGFPFINTGGTGGGAGGTTVGFEGGRGAPGCGGGGGGAGTTGGLGGRGGEGFIVVVQW